MNTIQQFFTQFDALPEDEQNVQQFLAKELTEKCGISPEESTQILQQISESLTQLESNHKELMECEKNGISEKRWLQEKLKETSAETNVPLEKVGEAFSTLVHREHQASIEELAGEKLNISEEPVQADLRTQLSEDLEAIHQTAFFQRGLAAQEAAKADSSVSSPTIQKALESDYFSPEEHKAKEIAAAAIYADSRQKAEEKKETYGSSWKTVLSSLPGWAAALGSRIICSSKAQHKIAEANGDHKKIEEAKRYDSSSLAAGYEQAIKEGIKYCASWAGVGIETLLLSFGFTPGTLRFSFGIIAAMIVGKNPYLKEFSEQLAEKTAPIVLPIVQKIKAAKSATHRSLVSTARSVMSVAKKKWNETTQKAKNALAGWFGF